MVMVIGMMRLGYDGILTCAMLRAVIDTSAIGTISEIFPGLEVVKITQALSKFGGNSDRAVEYLLSTVGVCDDDENVKVHGGCDGTDDDGNGDADGDGVNVVLFCCYAVVSEVLVIKITDECH